MHAKSLRPCWRRHAAVINQLTGWRAARSMAGDDVAVTAVRQGDETSSLCFSLADYFAGSDYDYGLSDLPTVCCA